MLSFVFERADGGIEPVCKLADVQPVDEAVVDLDRKAEGQPAALLGVAAPADAGDRIVGVVVALVGQGGQVNPGQAGIIDQLAGFGFLVNEDGLGAALFARRAAEGGQVVPGRQRDDLEGFRPGRQVGKR